MLMSDKMEFLPLLLMFFTVSGYAYVLQPRLTVVQMAGKDRDHGSELNSEQLRDVSFSAEERKNEAENITAVEEWMSERVSPEKNHLRKTVNKEKTVEERKGEDGLMSESKPEIIDMIEDNTEGGNIGQELVSEERLTPVTFSKSMIVGKETKQEEDSAADTLEGLGVEVEEDEGRKDDVNLIPNSKTETNDESKMVKTMLTDNPKNWKTVKNHKMVREGGTYETDVKFKKNDQMEQLMQTIVEEERESELVAGINLHMNTRRDSHGDESVKQEITEEKQGTEERRKKVEKEEDIKDLTHEFREREKENHPAFSILTPPLITSQVGKESEISATIQPITLSQIRPNYPPSHQHNVHPPPPITPTEDPPVSALPSTLHAKVSPQLLPFTSPTVVVVPAAVKSVSLLEDLLIEALQSPGQNLKQNELEGTVNTNIDNVLVKTLLFKPAQRELQSTHEEINKKSIHSLQDPTPKSGEAGFIDKDSKPTPTPESNENKFLAKMVRLTFKPNMTQPTGRPKAVRLMEIFKVTKPSMKLQLATDRTASVRQNKSSKTKTKKKSQEKRNKDNKTEKPPDKKKKKVVTTPVPFPYFMDNYCPPECACYGRVVQCSDKQVDKIPYGIPYNARYILLMNNHINHIQLGLLSEYISMEFLVLSNNQLTDGAVKGVFKGVLALKRLYLDRNLLETVPSDLPVVLEELRLDNNRLSVISEAAWAQCRSLLVLSLSNNSLGNGSGSLPNSIFSPLSKLRTLNLDHNQLKAVPLGLPLSVKELYLKGNFIEYFHGGVYNGISELVVLDLSANRLTDKGLRHSLLNATHLESLNFEGNRLKQVPRHLPLSLKTLNLEGNLITSIKKAAFSSLKNLEHLGLARNKIFKVAPGAFRTLHILHQLDLCHNTLHQVPRQLPQGLHSVELTHNKIQSVPRDAFCWGNQTLSISRLVRVQLEHNLIDMGKLDTHAFRCLRGFQVVHFY